MTHSTSRRLKTDDFNKRHTVVFDIDGVLCDSRSKIQAYMAGRKGHPTWGQPEFWDDYNHSLGDESPNEEWVILCNLLHEGGYTIVLLTARPEHTRSATRLWLDAHGVRYDQLVMWQKERTEYSEYKSVLIKELSEHGHDIKLVIDDSRHHVAAMRDVGHAVLHVQYNENSHDAAEKADSKLWSEGQIIGSVGRLGLAVRNTGNICLRCGGDKALSEAGDEGRCTCG